MKKAKSVYLRLIPFFGYENTKKNIEELKSILDELEWIDGYKEPEERIKGGIIVHISCSENKLQELYDLLISKDYNPCI